MGVPRSDARVGIQVDEGGHLGVVVDTPYPTRPSETPNGNLASLVRALSEVCTLGDGLTAKSDLPSVQASRGVYVFGADDDAAVVRYVTDESEAAGGGLHDDVAARADYEGDIAQVAGNDVDAGPASVGDVGHRLDDVLARIEGHLVYIASNTNKTVPGTFSLKVDPDDSRITRTVSDTTGHVVATRFDARTAAHRASPSVDGGGSPTVGDGTAAEVPLSASAADAELDVTPEMLDACANHVFDTQVPAHVATMLRAMAQELRWERGC
ncbi:hypothetical protein [Rhodococcoides fascians]|uniref:hypothetical protein n=1 Tax=Rhodococcoides fascians TaxID=1828 RepID=UPI000AEAC562|nr:hypothetical protein [Rhodococcus fascians]